MMAIAPHRVHLERAEPGDRRPLGALLPQLRSHGVRSVSANGVLGDPDRRQRRRGNPPVGPGRRGADRGGGIPALRHRARRLGCDPGGPGHRGRPRDRGSHGAGTGRGRMGGGGGGPGVGRPPAPLSDGHPGPARRRGDGRPWPSRSSRHRTKAQANGSWPTPPTPPTRTALGAAVAEAEDRFGGLDAMVAVAGVIAGGVPLWEMPAEQLDAVVDVDLRGPITAARVGIPALLRRPAPRSGRFLAVASAAAHRGFPMLAAYGAAKAGVAGLVRGLAAELGDSGVTANAVSPGSTATAILDQSARLYGLEDSHSFADQQPVKRLLTPGRGGRGAGVAGRHRLRGRDRCGHPRGRRPLVVIDRPAGWCRPGRPDRAARDIRPGPRHDGAYPGRGDSARRWSPGPADGPEPDRCRRPRPAAGEGAATGAVRALARRLVDAGMAHPRPAGGVRVRPGRSATVVVPVRDRSASLDRCLRALGTEADVVVVDDGSDDPASVAEVVARHGARLIRRAVNGGPGAARNEALAGLATELVAFVDSDCTVSPGWLPSLLWLFDDPSVGAVAPRIRPESGHPDDERSIRARYVADRSPLDQGPAPSEVGPGRRVRYVPSTALVVRASALVGGFDEDLRIGEDVDWVWRLSDAGWRVRYEPSVTVFHREPDSWSALLARRFRYGTAAAPLARRHPGRLAPLELRPWPTAAVGAMLARRPALAAALLAASTVRLSRGLRARGVPVWWSLRWTLQGAGWTTVGLGRRRHHGGRATDGRGGAALAAPGAGGPHARGASSAGRVGPAETAAGPGPVVGRLRRRRHGLRSRSLVGLPALAFARSPPALGPVRRCPEHRDPNRSLNADGRGRARPDGACCPPVPIRNPEYDPEPTDELAGTPWTLIEPNDPE